MKGIPVRISRPLAPIKRPMPTPLNPLDFAQIGKLLTDLAAMHEEVSAGIASVEKTGESYGHLAAAHEDTIEAMKKLQSTFESIKQGPPGKPGIPGIPGSNGTSVNHATVVTEVMGMIRQPKDGESVDLTDVVEALKPAVLKQVKKLLPKVKETAPMVTVAPVDVDQLLDQLFEEIQSGKRKLDVKHIQGLDTKFAEVRNAAAMATPQVYGKDTWARGGGDTVVAGANVTFGKDANGNKIINANPSGGFSIITVTGIVDDSNVTFGAATQPTLLNINGAFYQKTGGAYTWSYSGTTITLNQPVGAGGSIFGI